MHGKDLYAYERCESRTNKFTRDRDASTEERKKEIAVFAFLKHDPGNGWWVDDGTLKGKKKESGCDKALGFRPTIR